jgi:hypothetical protein
VLDTAVRIPGTPVRFGLDAVLGLIPGVGDVVGAAAAGYIVLAAARLGAPPSVLVRMLLNVGVDTVVGAVPLLGDLFDIGFKANSRNVRLLEASLDAPADTRRSSALVIGGVVIAALAIAAAGVALTVLLLRAVWNAAGG